MNPRLRALAVLVAVFLLGLSAGAMGYRFLDSKTKAASPSQPQGPGKDRPQRPKLEDILKMSPEQKTQFSDIWKEFRPQFEALRSQQEKKWDALRTEFDPSFDELRAEVNRRVMTILNDDQRKQFETFLKESNARRGNRHRPGPPPPDDHKKD